MLLPGLLLILCGCRGRVLTESVQQISSTEGAIVTDVRFLSPSLNRLLWYRVVVPKTSVAEHLPVLYFLHGADTTPAELMDSSPIVKLAVANRLIVVMPDGGYSYFTNAKHRGNARWEDAITRDLTRDVQARFPVLIAPGQTGIAGISMGGYGAVKIAMKHPEEYRFAGTMSGALEVTRRHPSLARIQQSIRLWRIFGSRAGESDEDVMQLLKRSTALKQVTWFVACGEKDPFYPANSLFERSLQQRGGDIQIRNTAGGHDWQTWNTVMPDLFQFAGTVLRPQAGAKPES